MNRTVFLQSIQKNVQRIKSYQLGHDGSDGTCDCIGLIIGAVRLSGEKWSGTHGSNYAARNAMKSLSKITSPSVLSPGDIVYKAYEPGASGYNLPATYKNSPDQRDYYHVGVVTAVNPLEITHCTGVQGGIKRDSSLGKWGFYGALKLVSEDSPLPTGAQAVVNAKAVALRKEPSVDAKVLLRVPSGDIVDLPDPPPSEWTYVSYKGKEGYMMTKFLTKGGDK